MDVVNDTDVVFIGGNVVVGTDIVGTDIVGTDIYVVIGGNVDVIGIVGIVGLSIVSFDKS